MNVATFFCPFCPFCPLGPLGPFWLFFNSSIDMLLNHLPTAPFKKLWGKVGIDERGKELQG